MNISVVSLNDLPDGIHRRLRRAYNGPRQPHRWRKGFTLRIDGKLIVVTR